MTFGGTRNRGVTAPEPIKYQKLKQIGKGTFGEVWQVMKVETGEVLAMKEIKSEKITQKELDAVEREIDLLSRLRHVNVVQIVEWTTPTAKEGMNILMECISGGSIHDIMDKLTKPMDEDTIRDYTKQMLEGLKYCHDQGVVHRDIKSRNILIDGNGIVKLADFGGAKLVSEEHGTQMMQASAGIHCTPLWLAPELANGGKYNHKIDIWSLGCTIIEMATLKNPWAEHNFKDVLKAVKHIGTAGNYPKWPSWLSDSAQDFLTLCLTRNPKDRLSAKHLLRHPFIAGEPEPVISPVTSSVFADVFLNQGTPSDMVLTGSEQSTQQSPSTGPSINAAGILLETADFIPSVSVQSLFLEELQVELTKIEETPVG